MWNLTSESKEEFLKSSLLPIHESDEEWEYALKEAQEEGFDLKDRLQEELNVVKDELRQILPSSFLPYVENGTLNQPSLPVQVREEYIQWMREKERDFEKVLDAAHEQTQESVKSLPASVQDVFEESLHDTRIERIQREENSLHLYINTDGGFTTKSFIHLSFHDVEMETDESIQVGQWIIYYELQKTNDGFALRILFEGPDAEWTIRMKGMGAAYYFRPMPYTTLQNDEKIEGTDLVEYLSKLNPEFKYWFITPDVICPITSISERIFLENGNVVFTENHMVLLAKNQKFIYELNDYNPINFIYTNVYEDPYAHFSEPVPVDEIEEAALGEELELQVRAWNTMYANPEELADIINRVLWKMEITEENEMMASVYSNYFNNAGILTDLVKEKYRNILG